MVEFGCVGAEKKWGSVLVLVVWFVVYHRKIRPTQLWVELSWVVAMKDNVSIQFSIATSLIIVSAVSTVDDLLRLFCDTQELDLDRLGLNLDRLGLDLDRLGLDFDLLELEFDRLELDLDSFRLQSNKV